MQMCDEYELELSAYRDGALPPAERERIASHVASCPSCKAALAAIEASHAALASMPKLKSPEIVRQRIREAIALPRVVAVRPRRARISWISIASGLAATLLIAVLGYV